MSNFRSSETHKGALRADRKIKELQFTREEEQKNFERLNELVEKLQQKTRTYKKQIEDAEEIAALNLAKFRKAQQVGVGGTTRQKTLIHSAGEITFKNLSDGEWIVFSEEFVR